MSLPEKIIIDDMTLLILTVAVISATVWAVAHALLNKRDPRSALVWVSLSLAMPAIGPLAYWLMGINRITRRAHKWHKTGRRSGTQSFSPIEENQLIRLPENYSSLYNLEYLADRVARTRTHPGNSIVPLVNGEEAYPAMLDTINQATHTIHLCCYIFDGNLIGEQFVRALAAAVNRGVSVRVIVDAMGERYSKVTARKALAGSGVDIRHFLPLYKGPFINLRNHRKLLVVDGCLAYTGGMNIRSNHCIKTADPASAASDLHFKVKGPVVGDLQRIFLEDWFFVTGEHLDDPALFPELQDEGLGFARAISDGPDRAFRKLEWIVLGALATAKKRVRIMTPYFIPDRPMVTALITAALQGVDVILILPKMNNLPFVAWASRASYWELIKNGVKIFEQPPPFAHTKLLLVDDLWSLIGSANFDTRSFRLNFELNLSVFDAGFAATLGNHFEMIKEKSKPITVKEMDGRPLPVKLRDAAARLFSPYL